MDRPPPSPLTGLFAAPTITSNYSHMRKVSGLRIAPTMMPVNPEFKRTGRPTAEDNVPNSFELFLLAPGEKKVTEETDTSKMPSRNLDRHSEEKLSCSHNRQRQSLTIFSSRNPICVRLYLPKRRPHARQPPSISFAPVSPCSLLWLQGAPSFGQVSHSYVPSYLYALSSHHHQIPAFHSVIRCFYEF